MIHHNETFEIHWGNIYFYTIISIFCLAILFQTSVGVYLDAISWHLHLNSQMDLLCILLTTMSIHCVFMDAFSINSLPFYTTIFLKITYFFWLVIAMSFRVDYSNVFSGWLQQCLFGLVTAISFRIDYSNVFSAIDVMDSSSEWEMGETNSLHSLIFRYSCKRYESNISPTYRLKIGFIDEKILSYFKRKKRKCNIHLEKNILTVQNLFSFQ